MKNITLLGIDLAKDVFQLDGVNEHGKKYWVKKLSKRSLDAARSVIKVFIRPRNDLSSIQTRFFVRKNKRGTSQKVINPGCKQTGLPQNRF